MTAKVNQMMSDGSEFPDELKPGTELLHGQYVIEDYLNSGGFGITYLAKDSLDRRVVIKECFASSFCRRTQTIVTVRSRAHAAEFNSIVKLFVQEAKNLAKLKHPNIVGVHQIFEDNDTAYMALDFVDGRDLLDMIEDPNDGMTPADIQAMTLKLLDAVDYVHSAGVLHRDISPDNILLERGDNNPVLIDFGAAREEASRQTRMLSAMRVVKDGYSPQEFYIQGSEQTPSSDLYALGATLYHLITGKVPPDSQQRLAAVAAQRPDPFKGFVGGVSGYSEAFLQAINKSMQIFPYDRLQSAREWLDLVRPSPEIVALPTSKVMPTRVVSRPVAQIMPTTERPEMTLSVKPRPEAPPAAAQAHPKAAPHAAAGTSTALATKAQAQVPAEHQPVDFSHVRTPEKARKRSRLGPILGAVAACVVVGLGVAYFTPQGQAVMASLTGSIDAPAADSVATAAPVSAPAPGNTAQASPAKADTEQQAAQASPAKPDTAQQSAQTASAQVDTAQQAAPTVPAQVDAPQQSAQAIPAQADTKQLSAQAAPDPAAAQPPSAAPEKVAQAPAPAIVVKLPGQSAAPETTAAATSQAWTPDTPANPQPAWMPNPSDTQAAAAPTTKAAPKVALDATAPAASEPTGTDTQASAAAAPSAPLTTPPKLETAVEVGSATPRVVASVKPGEAKPDRFLTLMPGASAEPSKPAVDAAAPAPQPAPVVAAVTPTAPGSKSVGAPVASSAQAATATSSGDGVMEASAVMSGWTVALPFSSASRDRAVVGEVKPGAPAWMQPGTRIIEVNGQKVATLDDIPDAVRKTTNLAGKTEVKVNVVYTEPGQTKMQTASLTLPAARDVALLNGMQFRTTYRNGAWQTVVAASPDKNPNGLMTGDQLIAYIPTSEKLNAEATISEIFNRELKAGTSRFAFAVNRNGELWVASVGYKANGN